MAASADRSAASTCVGTHASKAAIPNPIWRTRIGCSGHGGDFAAVHQPMKLVGREGSRKMETLHQLAAGEFEEHLLRRGLDAFGGHRHPHGMAERKHGRHDCSGV